MKIYTTNLTRFTGRCALFLVAMLVAASMAAPGAIAIAVVDLGSTANFAVLAGSTITNTGNTIIYGDVGQSTGTTISGFPPGVVNGTQHVNNSVTTTAESDLTNAIHDAMGRTTTATVPTELGGTILGPGVYSSAAGTFSITGDLTLNAGGDANAVWIFKMGSTLDTAAYSKVILTGGAQACNIFWQVGSSATHGSNSVFQGTIMASASITVNAHATLKGRALAAAAVTLDDNSIKLPEIPVLMAWYLGYTGSNIYKVNNGLIEPIPLDINSGVAIQPWEAFWFQANDPNCKLTMNFHPAQHIVSPGSPLFKTLGLSNKIYFISFPLVKNGTMVKTLFAGTSFDVDAYGPQFLLQKMIGGVVETYGTDTAGNFTVQAGRGYAIQHHSANQQLQIPIAQMKTDPELNAPVNLQLSVVNDGSGDYRTLNMLGNPFDHTIQVTSEYGTSNVFIEVETESIDGIAKIASGGYSDFVRNMETMERWYIGLAVADSRGELADTFNEAGVISANGDIDRLIDFYSSEDLILPGDYVRLVLRNPEKLDESKLCYDYRVGGQDSYTWNIELSTTLQAVDAKLSIGNLAAIPADYRIFITDPVTDESISVTSDTVLDVKLSNQFPKTLVLTASRQKITGVNELSRPASLKINSIYPNPFNPRTTISFTTNLPGLVEVYVYSATGQLVDTLVDTNMSAGSHQVSWDGGGQSSGVYIIKVKSGVNIETQQMTLIK